MLQRKVSSRLGFNGIQELKEHPWFENFNWDALYNKKMTAPFIPRTGDNFDKKYCEGIDKIGNDTYERYQAYYKSDNFYEVFKNYTCCNISEQKEEVTKSPIGKKLTSPLISQISANNLLNKKIKMNESNYFKRNSLSSNKNSSVSPEKKLKVKSGSMSTASLTPFNSQQAKSQSYTKFNSMISTNTPFKFNNEKAVDQLPFIDVKMNKTISKQKILSSNSSANKLTNSSSQNSIIKSINKFSTISSNSTNGMNPGSNNSLNHKRSGSTNYFQY